MRPLPAPNRDGATSVERAMARRRSVRDFDGSDLTDEELGQLLWAGQGVSGPGAERTAPSHARAYPDSLYVATREGMFLYRPEQHAIDLLAQGDLRADLMRAGMGQGAIWSASAVFVIAANMRRAEEAGGARGSRYAYIEAGHIGQNILLQATAMGLGGVPMGEIHDPSIRNVARFRPDDAPVYLIAVGRPIRPVT